MNRRLTTTSVILALAIITVFLLTPSTDTLNRKSPSIITDSFPPSEESTYPLYSIGTVEEIEVVEYPTLTDALEAIDEGEADLLGQRIEPDDYPTLDTYSSIIRQWAHDAKQSWLSLNAKSYPLNSYHLRQAIAYAINKTAIAEEAFEGLVDPVDFAISLGDALSVEQEEGGKFYDSDISTAQSMLGIGGMLDVDEDGYVEAQNGSDFCLTLTYPSDVEGMDSAAAIIRGDLLSAGINCTLEGQLGTLIQSGLFNHTLTYDLAIVSVEFSYTDPQWGITTFHSSRINTNGENIAQISDGEINAAVFQYEDAFSLQNRQSAVIEGLRVIRDRCPVVPLFNYRWLSVYSTENFDNWPDDWIGGAFSVWTPVTITAKPTSDNILRVAVLPTYFADFFKTVNVLDSSDVLDHEWAVTQQFNPYLLIYDSPFALSPEKRYVPRASTSWNVLYRSSIADIDADQTRVRLYVDPNANWTDGVSLNSEDYRFTYNLLANQSKTLDANLTVGFKTTGEFQAGITMDTLDPFTYRSYSELPILPRHIWEPQNLSVWTPSVEDAVGSGPYAIEQFTVGSSLTLSINRGYYPVIDEEPPTLNRINQYPEEPIPAESVVIRVYISDRSRIANVTLEWTHQVGDLNFTSSMEMSETAIGYLGTIPSRITAESTSYRITATDIWGNTALIATGYYERSTGTTQDGGLLTLVAIAGFVITAIIIFVVSRRRKQ
ncbi:hypothetical protein EU538_02585 [Candidatus Thorarchaeota archaeon]|nr:MAG: hypothetical protein EU538_02585 [Candidatus Thorarchaeota archaeon]